MISFINGTHLQLYTVEGKHSRKELGHFGEWVVSTDFEPLSNDMGKCKHKDRDGKLKPVLKELNFKARNLHRGAKQRLTSSRNIGSSIKSFVQIRKVGLSQTLHI
jgi:hypothetical protein